MQGRVIKSARGSAPEARCNFLHLPATREQLQRERTQSIATMIRKTTFKQKCTLSQHSFHRESKPTGAHKSPEDK